MWNGPRADRPVKQSAMGRRSQRPSPIHPACIPGSIPPSSASSALAFRSIGLGNASPSGRSMQCPSRFVYATAHPQRSPKDVSIAVHACMPRCTNHNPTDHGVAITPSPTTILLSPETRLNVNPSQNGVTDWHCVSTTSGRHRLVTSPCRCAAKLRQKQAHLLVSPSKRQFSVNRRFNKPSFCKSSSTVLSTC